MSEVTNTGANSRTAVLVHDESGRGNARHFYTVTDSKDLTSPLPFCSIVASGE
jgi:hypothetical protein